MRVNRDGVTAQNTVDKALRVGETGFRHFISAEGTIIPKLYILSAKFDIVVTRNPVGRLEQLIDVLRTAKGAGAGGQ